jgi:hypothetical protein
VLKRDRSLKAVEDSLLPVADIYQLTGLASFAERENYCAALATRLGGKHKRKTA